MEHAEKISRSSALELAIEFVEQHGNMFVSDNNLIAPAEYYNELQIATLFLRFLYQQNHDYIQCKHALVLAISSYKANTVLSIDQITNSAEEYYKFLSGS